MDPKHEFNPTQNENNPDPVNVSSAPPDQTFAPDNPVPPPIYSDNTAPVPARPTAQPGVSPHVAGDVPTAFYSVPEGESPPPQKKSKKKLIIALTVGTILTIFLSAGVVFGYYLPNKPENVYRTGLDRSGKVVDKLIDQATEKDKLEQIKKGSELDGLLEVSTIEDGGFNGTFNVKLDPTKSNGNLDFKISSPGESDRTLGLKFLTDLQKDKRFPDLYFQLTGLKSMGADDYAPGLSDYEGKWISVEADFLESLGAGFLPPVEHKNKENISAGEIADLIRAVSDVGNEYLFTADANKAVFENREYLGKEKTAEGINSFHYKVGINRSHAAEYCKALSDKVLSQIAVKKIANLDDKDIEDAKKTSIGSCDSSVKELEDETFEMWIDAKYKVIHKIRYYTNITEKTAYTDIGQIYTGGDKLALFSKYHDDYGGIDIKFTLDVDVRSFTSKAGLTASAEDDAFFGDFRIEGSLAAKPYDGEVKADKPAGAIPVKDILTRFGFDPTYLSGIENNSGSGESGASGLQTNSRNTQRKNDVSRVAAAMNEYVANNNGNVPATSAVFNAQVMANAKTDIYKTANVKYAVNPGGTQAAPPDTTQLFIMTNMKCDQAGTRGVVTGATKRTFIALYRIEGGTDANGTPICQEI